MSSRQVHSLPYVLSDAILIISYVSREKAMSEGLAFWTDDGTPGIQVSLTCPIIGGHELKPIEGGTLGPPSRGPESGFCPNHFSRFILRWIIFDRFGIDALGMWCVACL